ncbi:MAG: hypothetical protein U0P45_06895 [Acidimicrobiales bacterium]
MRRIRPLVLATVALLAFGTAACGVDAGDAAADLTTTSTTVADSGATGGLTAPSTTEGEGDTTTTAPSKQRTPEDQAVVDQMAKAYEELGLSTKESECLASGVFDMIDGGGDTTDAGAIMDIVNECDIPMSKLSQIGSGTDGTFEGGFKRGIVISLKQAGLSEEQATCVADAYVEKFGTDLTASRNANQMRPLLRGCGVTANTVLGN